MRVRFFVAAVAASSLLLPGLASAVLDPAIKCQAAKLKLAGKYASCRLLADAAAVKNGTAANYSTCDTKIQEGWAKVEASLGTECPTAGDLDDVQTSIVECIPAKQFVMRIFMATYQPLSSLQYFVSYSQVNGSVPGTDTNVECTNMVPGALAAYADRDDARYVDMGLINLSNMSGFIEITRCTFDNEGIVDPDPADFIIGVTAATDENGNNVIAPDMSLVLEKKN
jgi:hypothetical protein